MRIRKGQIQLIIEIFLHHPQIRLENLQCGNLRRLLATTLPHPDSSTTVGSDTLQIGTLQSHCNRGSTWPLHQDTCLG